MLLEILVPEYSVAQFSFRGPDFLRAVLLTEDGIPIATLFENGQLVDGAQPLPPGRYLVRVENSTQLRFRYRLAVEVTPDRSSIP